MKKLNNLIKSLAMVLIIASGTTAKAQTQAVFRLPVAENRVAILPITYISEGNDTRMDEMRYRLQTIAYQYLRSDALELRFQDPAETNALLLKNGITESNFRRFSPAELAAILKVEYVVTGMVSQDYAGESTYRRSEGRNYHRKGKFRRETNGYSRTRQELSTHIGFDIYNDRGENVYSKSRRSILSDVNAYRNGMQYLLKRSPLYGR